MIMHLFLSFILLVFLVVFFMELVPQYYSWIKRPFKKERFVVLVKYPGCNTHIKVLSKSGLDALRCTPDITVEVLTDSVLLDARKYRY